MNGQTRFYRGIPVVPKRSSELEVERGHHHLSAERLTGRVTFDLVALQPLHVGHGALWPPEKLGLTANAPLVKAFFRVDNTLTIPGSSLKGAFRSLLEMFTYSCVSKTTVRWPDQDRTHYSECLYSAKRQAGNLCPACKIFGAMGYQGQVRFDDAPQVTGDHDAWAIPPQYKPQPDRQQRRYYPYALRDNREPTWPVEVATVGSSFRGRMQFTNLLPGELGLLLIALGQGQWRLCPRLGAGKSSGLGGVRIENLAAEQWSIDQAYQAFESDVWQAVDVTACLEAAQSWVQTNILTQLARDLKLA